MFYYEFMKRLFSLLVLLIIVSIIFTNWERLQWIQWGAPKAEELNINEKPAFASNSPIVVSPDEKINTEVF